VVLVFSGAWQTTTTKPQVNDAGRGLVKGRAAICHLSLGCALGAPERNLSLIYTRINGHTP
jgi:hypothetical protein